MALYGTNYSLYKDTNGNYFFYDPTSGNLANVFGQGTLFALFGDKWETNTTPLNSTAYKTAPLLPSTISTSTITDALNARGSVVGTQGNIVAPYSAPTGTSQTQAIADAPLANNTLSAPAPTTSAPVTTQTNPTQANPNYTPGSVTSSPTSQAPTTPTSGSNPVSGSVNPGTLPGTGPTGAALGLSGDYAALYDQLNIYLQKLTANGQTVNPNVQITPDQIAKFTAQAQAEINPYYANQLATARQQLMQSLGYSTSQIQQQEQDLQKTYGNSLRSLAGNLADQGFAQSGAANRGYNDLATSTQSSIDQARSALSNSASNAVANFAQKFGSGNAPSFNISGAPRVLPGQANFQTAQGSNPLYTLSPNVYNGLTGSEQYQQTADINNRVSQLSQAYNQGQINNQTRSLNL